MMLGQFHGFVKMRNFETHLSTTILKARGFCGRAVDFVGEMRVYRMRHGLGMDVSAFVKGVTSADYLRLEG